MRNGRWYPMLSELLEARDAELQPLELMSGFDRLLREIDLYLEFWAIVRGEAGA